MTEFEAISLFNEFLGNILEILFGYISILSAFLVMGYFAADKINMVLTALLLALFTFTSLMFILQFNYLKIDLQNLNLHIMEIQSTNLESSKWFGKVPAWAIGMLTITQNIGTIGGYIGCVAFFLYRIRNKVRHNDT